MVGRYIDQSLLLCHIISALVHPLYVILQFALPMVRFTASRHTTVAREDITPKLWLWRSMECVVVSREVWPTLEGRASILLQVALKFSFLQNGTNRRIGAVIRGDKVCSK
jgi:hypothetical protein